MDICECATSKVNVTPQPTTITLKNFGTRAVSPLRSAASSGNPHTDWRTALFRRCNWRTQMICTKVLSGSAVPCAKVHPFRSRSGPFPVATGDPLRRRGEIREGLPPRWMSGHAEIFCGFCRKPKPPWFPWPPFPAGPDGPNRRDPLATDAARSARHPWQMPRKVREFPSARRTIAVGRSLGTQDAEAEQFLPCSSAKSRTSAPETKTSRPRVRLWRAPASGWGDTRAQRKVKRPALAP